MRRRLLIGSAAIALVPLAVVPPAARAADGVAV